MIEDLIVFFAFIWGFMAVLIVGWGVVWVLDWFGIIDKDERL
jgi:hypothetical protein